MTLRGVCGGGRDGESHAGTDCSLTLPAGCQPGDLLVFITSANLGAPTADVGDATILHGPDTAQANNKAYVCSLTLDAATIAAGTVPIAWSSTGRTIASGVVLYDVTGVESVAYADALTTDIPEVTTAEDGCPVVLLAASRTDSGGAAVSTYPSGYTKATDAKTTFASGVNTANSIALLDTPGPAGSYGGGSVSYTPTPTSSHTYAIAVTPAVVAPNEGAAATGWAGIAAATGEAPAVPVPQATASTGWTSAATAAGSAPPVPVPAATASTSWTALATATGAAPEIPVPTATAATTWAATASATGSAPQVPVPQATAATAWPATATAQGAAPVPGVNAGRAATTWTAAAAAAGAAPVIPTPTATATTGWAAATGAEGAPPPVGVPSATAEAAWSAVADATGSAPLVPISAGAALAIWSATATATGRAPTVTVNAGAATTSWAAEATAEGAQPGSRPDWPTSTTLTPVPQPRAMAPVADELTLIAQPEPRTMEATRDQ